MIRSIFYTVIFLLSFHLRGQQEIILTKYTYQAMLFNPAYAGCHGFDQGTAMIQHRSQWLGLEGAPVTSLVTIERSFSKDRIGLGMTVAYEGIGIDERYDATFNYAYRIPFKSGNLGLGIRIGYAQFLSDFNKLKYVDLNDPLYANNQNHFYLINTGFGSYYNNETMYVGFAIPSISVLAGVNKKSFKARHMYFHTGAMLGNESSIIKVEPSLMIAYQKATPIQYTFGMNLWFDQIIAIGGHLRSGDALAISSEYFLTDHFRIAAAYDFTISEIKNYQDGSLEVMLAYHLFKKSKTKKIRHIRYGGRF